MKVDNKKVVFFKDVHEYYHGNRKLPSVGHWTKKYFPPFMENYWLTHKTLQEYFGDEYSDHYKSFKRFQPISYDLFSDLISKMGVEKFVEIKTRIKGEWSRKRNEAAFNGTKFHDMMEQRAYDDGYLINPWDNKKYVVKYHKKTYDNESLCLDLSKLPDGAYLELLVFDLNIGVAGQADMVFIETIDGVRYVDINDHKTNEKKPGKSAPEKCFPPFNNDYASTHFKYVLQINSYAYILSLHGFVPRNLAYTYYKNYDEKTATLVDVENRCDDIKGILC